MSKETQKANLEKQLSAHIGQTVEITVRDLRSFTFSTPLVDVAAAEKIAEFFKGQGKISIEHDPECGSFVYLDA